MIVLPAVAIESIVTSVLKVIEKGIDLETKRFDALAPADKSTAAREHYASIGRWHEHEKNFHAVLLWIFELIGGKALVESQAPSGPPPPPVAPAKPPAT